MTPQEIVDYKNKWRPGHLVDVHSDMYTTCVSWCRKVFPQQSWYAKKYTDVYSSSYYFENERDATRFMEQFEYWVDKGKST